MIQAVTKTDFLRFELYRGAVMSDERTSSDDLSEALADALPHSMSPVSPAEVSTAAPRSAEVGDLRKGLEVVGGVMLPGVTLLMEGTSRMCADAFFDPMPTIWHAGLVALVPVTNLVSFLMRPASARGKRIAMLMNGIALGISMVYALVFLPLTPIAIPAILLLGVGLLPLSPFFSALAAFSLRSRLAVEYRDEARSRIPSIVIAFAAVFVLFLLPEVPEAVTRYGLQSATHGTAEERLAGVEFLRKWVNQERILSYCYDEDLGGDDFFRPTSSGSSVRLSNLFNCDVTTSEARDVFYRVTGKTSTSFDRPRHGRRGWRGWGGWSGDANLGGDSVASKVDALTLESSRMDMAIHPDALTTYSEWTMVFRNDDSFFAKEARAQILLPPDAVVSRLTLWINGEPCEAAFGSAGSVRDAYQKVAVEQRRDPVLVTHAGIDRILMQCFPVPRNGKMKIRIGVTAPLHPKADTADILLPSLTETNFRDHSEHSVWFTGAKVQGGVSRVSGGTQGVLDSDQLASARFQVECPNLDTVRVKNTVEPGGLVVQTYREVQVAPSNCVFVVDGSLAMHDHFEGVADAISKVADSSTRIIVAGDGLTELKSSEGSLADAIADAAAEGGCDNVPALIKAWDIAPEKNAAIVWFHGPQPLDLSEMNQLAQRFEYGNDGLTLHCFSVVAGPNRLLEQLPTTARVRVHRPDSGDLVASLQSALSESQMEFERRIEPESDASQAESVAGADHVVRMWARDEVSRLLADDDRSAAANLGIAHRLVTPVTGAVVLENQAQYDAAGLTPVDPHEVPTIPEPEVWLMLIVGAIMIAFVSWKRRRARLAGA